MKYRKKPVVIDAIQWTGVNLSEISAFTGPCAALNEATNELMIFTLEDGVRGDAKHAATVGDFVIKGVQGEFYFCKPDIFAATYELAE